MSAERFDGDLHSIQMTSEEGLRLVSAAMVVIYEAEQMKLTEDTAPLFQAIERMEGVVSDCFKPIGSFAELLAQVGDGPATG